MRVRIPTSRSAAVAALLALLAGKAAALPPPLPSLDGVNPVGNGPIPNATSANGNNGVVRRSGPSTSQPPVFADLRGDTLDILSQSRRVVIDWRSFNIGEGYRVNFLMPDRGSVAVNRVTGIGQDFVSRIDGDLWSNGNVWLLNPNGVFFGAKARVDVAGLLATPAYLRKLDDFIRPDGGFDASSVIGFNMPGSSYPTAVAAPGAVEVAAGAEILVRGGPAMFITGSGVQGRTLRIGGTVTARTGDLVRGVLAPPAVMNANGDYGSLPTAGDPAEVTSSQVVYAASGDFSLSLIGRDIAEPSPPNPLSSKDLDLFDFIVERGFAGRQGPADLMAPEAILVEGTARTVAGQVVVRSAAESGALLRRHDPRTDLGCDPAQPTCTITRNPDHDTYIYDEASGQYQQLCAKGPAAETCGTLTGRQVATGFVYAAYLGVETTRAADYGCAADPDCAPGIRIASSLTALDPRTDGLPYGYDLAASMVVDAAPSYYRGGLVLTTDTSGRPIDVMVAATPRSASVSFDPRSAAGREFDFGPADGVRQVALEMLSAGDLEVYGRDICVTADGSCFQEGALYRASDAYANPGRVNLRLQAARRAPYLAADRLLRLEETFLGGADLELRVAEAAANGVPPALGQIVLRNALIDPQAGSLSPGYILDRQVRIIAGTAAGSTNAITVGGISGGASTVVDLDAGGGRLQVLDPAGQDGSRRPAEVSGGDISLAGTGVRVGDIHLEGHPQTPARHTVSLLSRSADAASFEFGVISVHAPTSMVAVSSAADLVFDPSLQLDVDALPVDLKLASTGGKLCVGATGPAGCIVADLALEGFVDLLGHRGLEVGSVTAGRIVRLRAAQGSVTAGDVDAATVDVQAGTRDAPAPGEDPYVSDAGDFKLQVGAVQARDGTVLLQGRDGVRAGDVRQSRVGASTPTVGEVELRSKSGSIVAGTVQALGVDPAVGGSLKVETGTGARISLAAVTAGVAEIHAAEGAVSIGVEGGTGGFAAGAVTARSGRIVLGGRTGVTAGALTAATQVDVSAARGAVAVGDVRAGGPAAAPGSPCNGLAVCIGAGFDGVDGSGRTLTTGSVIADTGAVTLVGRDGVTTGGVVSASAGGIEIRSPSGTVDTSAGTVTAGTTAGDHDAKLVGSSLKLGDVVARRDIDLAATAPTGTLTAGVLTAGRALTVRSVADLGIGAASIGGTPQSVLLASSDGGVCLGARVDGVCTGQALTKATDLTLQGRTGVTAGALAVRSALADSAQGAVSLGDVTVTDGRLALYGRTGVTAGKLVQSRTGGTQTAPDIDLISGAGSIRVGDVTGSGLMYGRAAEGLTTGAIAGVKDIDLRAGKALATGAVTATGFVQLESVEGSLTTGAVSAGAAKAGSGTDPCSGKAVCLRAGEAATAGTQTVGTGVLRATTGDISVQGRSGVTVGDATATAGSVTLRSTAGAISGAAIDAGKSVDAQALGGALAVGAVTARDGTVLLRGRDGVTAGRIAQTRTGGALQVPDVTLAADQGAVSVGDIGSTGSLRGDAATDLTTGALTAGAEVRLLAGRTITTGDVVSAGGVGMQAGTGSLTVGDITAAAALQGGPSDRCNGRAVCLHAGEGASSGTQVLRTGDLVATNGAMSLSGRSGVTIDSARADRGSIRIDTIAGGVVAGALTAGDVQGSAPLPYRVWIVANDAITIGTAAAPAPVRATGEILMSSAAGDIDAGALSAGRLIDLHAAGSLRLGALSARGTATLSSDDPCNGASVCVTAGGGPQTGPQTATVGPITADAGSVFLAAPTVTLGGATASDGDIVIRSGSGAVTATGGLAAGGSGATAVDRDVIVSGGAVALRGVRASGDIILEATGVGGSSGTIRTGALQARRALSLQSVAALDLAAVDIIGDPESIRLASSGGSVCLGTRVDGVCTGQPLSKNSTAVELVGRTGVTTGDLGVKGLQVRVSEGAAVSGAITSGQRIDIAARDGVKTGDVAAQKDVALVASAGSVDAGRVAAADGTVLLQGRTGVKAGAIVQARTGGALQVPDVELIADGGSIAVGAVSGTGSLRGRALDDLAIGAVSGVDAVDLSAGKALSANGAIVSRGAVELRSDTGNLVVQDVTAGAAKAGGGTDPCAGKAICVRAGAGASSGTQTLTTGKLTASAGAVLLRGRSGVTTGDVRADRGVIDIGAAAGGATLGALRGSGAVTVSARDAVSAGDVVGATTDAGDVVMSSTDGALAVKSVTAGTASVASNLELRSKGDLVVASGAATPGNLSASGGVRMESGAALRVGDITAGGAVRATAQGALAAGAVTSTADAVDISARDGAVVGALRATDATVTASGGDVVLGAVTARTLTVSAAAGQAGTGGGAGDVRLGGAVTLVPAAGTPAGATPALRVQAARDITVAGAVTSERNVSFVAGRNFANSGAISVTAGTAADGSGAAGYGGIDIRAADAEIGAQLRARGAGVNLLATGSGGIALGDGITAATGAMRLTDAELQSIDAPTAALRSATGATAGRDIVVGDLTLDRARIGELTLATRQGGKVRVTGTLRGTGAPALQIGESGMRPDAIEVSGALGASDAAIGTLQLRSAGNILFGPQTFIDAVNAAQDIQAFDVVAASQGAGAGRLFLVSGATSFDAPGAILQQNTGGSSRDGDGIRIGAPAGVVTATFATGTPPQRIALFGRVVDAQGSVLSGQAASLVTGLLPSGVSADPAWRINTCVIGTGAGCATTAALPPPSVLVQPPLPPPPAPPPPPASGPDTPPPTAAGGGTSGGAAGGAAGGAGAQDEDDERTAEAGPEPQPVQTLADAAPSAEERRIYPLEVDPGSRDLLRPVDDGMPREPGVGSANEDLWPQGAPPP